MRTFYRLKPFIILLFVFVGGFAFNGCGGPQDGDVADAPATEADEAELTEEEAANEPTEY
ncbi:hypothetical protein [Rubinisphaera sp.]|uniref:hypothetical protein n=1 Tax=Rubinisphaera sp. TaxID=2024857 RepID=UPI0025F475CF|nr:hypothetical protein [Rubinisphaera sp.]|tara:strand:- start:259 stop:438 length:180 start_codon:yes stop_codon:yes gene_type:complete